MRAVSRISDKARCLLILFLLGGFWLSEALSAEPNQQAKTEPPAAKPGAAAPAKPKADEPTFAFDMRDKPWATVFEWLNEHSGLFVIYGNKPSGTFNFIPSKDKRYTIAEIMDILNEQLLTQNYVLIRRDQSFLLVPATEKVDPSLVPRVSVEDLAKRGNTELVSVVVPLKGLVAEDMVSEVKEMLGQFGKVVDLKTANQLVITDTAKNVKLIVKTLKGVEENEIGQVESYSYACKYIRARDAAKTLEKLLGDPERERRMQSPPGFGGRGGPPGAVQMAMVNGRPVPQGAPAPAANAPKIRMHYIDAVESTNTVLVTGPANKIAQAKTILKDIDMPQPGGSPLPIGKAEWVTYNVPAGMADALVKTLTAIFRESNTLRIAAIGNSRLMVYATPADQLDIAQYIHKAADKPIQSEVIDLQNQDAEKLVKVLKDVFGDMKTGAPFIDADPSGRNAIFVRGSPDQIAEVKAALKAMGETGTISGNMRVISVDKGNAAVLAGALEEYLRDLRGNKVKVVIPGREPLPTKNGSGSGRGGSEEQEEPPQQKSAAPQNKAPQEKGKTSQEPGNQLFDPRAKKAQSKEGAPITITVVGNRLIITSEDPKALQMAQELARVLTQAPGGEGQFEIIRLKYANAVEVAKILDEMFTGNKQQQQNQYNPFIYGFGGRSRQPQEDKNQPRIVADPATNALLVKASPLEMATIRNLVTKALDVPVGGQGQFEVITLKHANADQVAKVLDEVLTGNKSTQNQSNPFFPFGRMPNTPTPSGQVRIVSDSATNSLLVKASPQDMKIVHELLDKYLDVEPNSSAVAKTYVIGPLKYANATDVAALVKDVYREHINNNPVGGVSQPTGGFSPFSGFSRRSRGVPNQNIDANGNPRAVDLSIGIDDRSNSLVVMCSKAMYEDIKKLADSLDSAAHDSTRTVEVVRLQGVDPVLVQQAIDAIQGRTTNGAQPGTPGFVPFGMGGVVPGSSRGSRGGTSGSGGTSPGSSGGGGRGTRSSGSSRNSGSSRGSGQQSRGPDFFAERVTDDPEPILFDPQLARQTANHATHGAQPVGADHDNLQLVKHEEQQPAPTTQPPPFTSEPVRGPRSNVTAEALPELGVIIVSGNNAADVQEILRVIELIRRVSKGTEIKFQLVPLKHADASYVTFTLNQMFQRVQVSPTGNIPARTTGAPTPTPGAFGAPGAAPPTTTGGTTSVVLLPIPRQNAILVAAPEARLKDVRAEIARLDVPNAPPSKATAFPLKKASAARVDQLLNSFYAARYSSSGETQAVDQIRITHDDSTNTVYVQAAPADLAEIADMIARIDTTVSAAVNEIRIVPLKNVTSDEMQAIIQQAINQATAIPTIGGTSPGLPTTPGTTGIPGATGLPGATRPGGTFPGTTGPTGGFPGTATGALPGTTGVPSTPQATTKSTTLRFVLPTPAGARSIEAGMLEDVHLTSFPRLNSLLVAAPEKSMELLLTLINALDTLPSLHAELKVFTLRKADASATAILLQQLFLGVGGIAGPTTVTPGGGPGGAPTPGGAIPGGAPGAAPAGGTPRQMTPLVLPGISPEGAPLIELRLAVDTRTNSIIVAGSPNDVFAIELIVRRLEDTAVQARRNMIYHVRNSTAADLANALTSFLTSSLQVYSRGLQLPPYQDILREVVVVPEPITNKLLISATPQYYDEVMRLIAELDSEPPQVVIQCLIAEVDLTNTDEFGVEIGLQSPVLFQRGIFPAADFATGSSSSFTSMANAAGANEGLVPFGTTVSTTSPANPVGQPGFLFNTTSPLGNNVAVSPGIVGFQGLNNLGVGRVSPNAPVGGFVFSAASDTFNLLIRALKTQGRMEILSRPQLMTLDNQTASIQVGMKYPYLAETSATLGTVTSGVTYENTGVLLNVTPRISPDGKVLMRVNPAIETPLAQINLGGGFLGTPFEIQTVTTTVLTGDGETVAIGGLIQKRDNKTENKIPWFGDLPGVGVLFRYRQQVKSKTELLIILTPHIVRSRAEADMILDMEAKRMDWTKIDVVKTHGSPGIPPILPPAPPLNGPTGSEPLGGPALSPPAPMMQPAPLMIPPTSVPGAPATNEQVPAPRPVPTAPAPGVKTSATAPVPQGVSAAAYTTAAQAAASAPPRGQAPVVPPSIPPTVGNGKAILPASKDSEKSKWSILKPWSWVGKDID